MLLKRTTPEGEKYYIDRFSGQRVEIPYKSPVKVKVKKTKTDKITYGPPIGFSISRNEEKAKKVNGRRSANVGDFLRLIRTDPDKRDRKEFIKVCKRLNINPYPLINIKLSKKHIGLNFKQTIKALLIQY